MTIHQEKSVVPSLKPPTGNRRSSLFPDYNHAPPQAPPTLKEKLPASSGTINPTPSTPSATPPEESEQQAINVHWLDPKSLHEHPRNAELFGKERRANFDDLIISLRDTGFDPGRPIRAVKRPEGSLVVIDGHRRRAAALHLDMASVPVQIVTSFSDAYSEEREMVAENVVRNHKHSSVPKATTVRLVLRAFPFVSQRGRPRKKKEVLRDLISDVAHESSVPALSDEPEKEATTRRDYYAGLLGWSGRLFHMVDYVLSRGTEQDCVKIDLGEESPTAAYNRVRRNLENVDPPPPDDPHEVARKAKAALRAVNKVLAVAQQPLALSEKEVEAAGHTLLDLASNEAAQKVPPGATLARSMEFIYSSVPPALLLLEDRHES